MWDQNGRRSEIGLQPNSARAMIPLRNNLSPMGKEKAAAMKRSQTSVKETKAFPGRESLTRFDPSNRPSIKTGVQEEPKSKSDLMREKIA